MYLGLNILKSSSKRKIRIQTIPLGVDISHEAIPLGNEIEIRKTQIREKKVIKQEADDFNKRLEKQQEPDTIHSDDVKVDDDQVKNGLDERKAKTRSDSEDQLSDIGRYEPVPLTKNELAAVDNWTKLRNVHLKKWREIDISIFPEETGSLLKGKSLNAIRKNMKPDDLAAIIKEKRGVIIYKPDGITPYKHLDGEWVGAQRAIIKELRKINDRIKILQKNIEVNSREINILQDKQGDLMKVWSEYKMLININE